MSYTLSLTLILTYQPFTMDAFMERLTTLTDRQLHTLCRNYGIRGYARHGLRRRHRVTMLKDHWQKTVMTPFEGHFPPELLSVIATYSDNHTFLTLLCSQRDVSFYMEPERRIRFHAKLCHWMTLLVCESINVFMPYCSMGVFMPRYTYTQVPVRKELQRYITPEIIERYTVPTDDMVVAAAEHICNSHQAREYFGYINNVKEDTKAMWLRIIAQHPIQRIGPYIAKKYHDDKDILHACLLAPTWSYNSLLYLRIYGRTNPLSAGLLRLLGLAPGAVIQDWAAMVTLLDTYRASVAAGRQTAPS